jgi:hypothetical protein
MRWRLWIDKSRMNLTGKTAARTNLKEDSHVIRIEATGLDRRKLQEERIRRWVLVAAEGSRLFRVI